MAAGVLVGNAIAVLLSWTYQISFMRHLTLSPSSDSFDYGIYFSGKSFRVELQSQRKHMLPRYIENQIHDGNCVLHLQAYTYEIDVVSKLSTTLCCNSNGVSRTKQKTNWNLCNSGIRNDHSISRMWKNSATNVRIYSLVVITVSILVWIQVFICLHQSIILHIV